MAGTIERLTLREGAATRTSWHQETLRLHQDRYRFAARWAEGATVLDLACGAGYGSDILSKAGAKHVHGADISPDAIAEANETFAQPGVSYHVCDYRLLGGNDCPQPLADAARNGFDLIVSLETIEHLPDPADFIRTVCGFLKPGGVFVGSVPVTPSMDANPFHLQDFSPGSFRGLLTRHGGLRIESAMRQRQPFNPLSVKKEMASNERSGLRQSLLGYYARNPGKLALRLYATVRHGFVNLYDVVQCRKP